MQGSGGSNADAGEGWLTTTAPLKARMVRNARRNFFMAVSLSIKLQMYQTQEKYAPSHRIFCARSHSRVRTH
jgi:hypothetical protein